MAEWSSNAVQTVNPGESVIFTENPVPPVTSLVRHRPGTGVFMLTGVNTPCRKSSNYLVTFGANIAIPTGGTVEDISLAVAIDGATIPSSQMMFTPAAVEEYGNVSCNVNAAILCGCCESVTIRNISNQPILVQNANVIFAR